MFATYFLGFSTLMVFDKEPDGKPEEGGSSALDNNYPMFYSRNLKEKGESEDAQRTGCM
jgi:hypothetical protein